MKSCIEILGQSKSNNFVVRMMLFLSFCNVTNTNLNHFAPKLRSSNFVQFHNRDKHLHHSDKKGWNYSIWFGFFTCISNLKHCGFCDQVLHLCKGDIFCNNNEGSIIVYFTSWHITVTLVVISVYYCAVTSLIQQYIYTKKLDFLC